MPWRLAEVTPAGQLHLAGGELLTHATSHPLPTGPALVVLDEGVVPAPAYRPGTRHAAAMYVGTLDQLRDEVLAAAHRRAVMNPVAITLAGLPVLAEAVWMVLS